MLRVFIRHNIEVKKITGLFVKLFLFILVLLPFYTIAAELQPYYIQKIDSSENKITVKDGYGRFYLLTHGPECNGWWKYVGQRVYINARGQFLNGEGDDIFLGVGSRACPIWKVSTVKGGAGYYSIQTSSICPDHGYISPVDPNTCECTTGYKYDPERHICATFKTNDQICREKFGIYSIWDGTLNAQKALNCGCKQGFMWNQNKTACIRDVASVNTGPVAKGDTAATNETQDATPVDSVGTVENAQTETTVTNNTQNNTQRSPWYKTFWGLLIILVAIMLIVYSFVKSYKNRH